MEVQIGVEVLCEHEAQQSLSTVLSVEAAPQKGFIRVAECFSQQVEFRREAQAPVRVQG